MSREFPALLKKFHAIKIDYADGDGIDFEPFDKFYSEAETSDWIKAWTGNDKLDGHEYLIFGQDGSGGHAAFWIVRDTDDLLQQPVVFFGSEGETGVVALNFNAYIWLFANCVGPCEAVENPGFASTKNQEFLEFAKKHAALSKGTASEIVDRAKSEYPDFSKNIDQLCQ